MPSRPLVTLVLGNLTDKSSEDLANLKLTLTGKHTCFCKSPTCKPGPELENRNTSVLRIDDGLKFACLYHAQVWATIEDGVYAHAPATLLAIDEEFKRREEVVAEQRKAVTRLHDVVRKHLAQRDGVEENLVTDQMVMAKLAKMTEIQKIKLRELAETGRLEKSAERASRIHTEEPNVNKIASSGGEMTNRMKIPERQMAN